MCLGYLKLIHMTPHARTTLLIALLLCFKVEKHVYWNSQKEKRSQKKDFCFLSFGLHKEYTKNTGINSRKVEKQKG